MDLLHRLSALLSGAVLACAPLAAGADCTRDAMIVFDGSGSMAEMGFNQIGAPRITEAREAMHRVIPEIAALRRLGLVVYGPGGDQVCENTELHFPPRAQAADDLLGVVDALRPTGGTPLTEAVLQAAETLNYRDAPGDIVLITDGDETCGGAPCQLAARLASEAPELVVHVIGFKVRGKHFSWQREGTDYHQATSNARCIATQTGGEYLRAETAQELIGALRVTLGCNIYSALEMDDPAILPPGALPIRK
ncbi:MAG: VWA domain-containing protein [Pelagimonas sp.]|jgi:Ca-activated chloride channel family protein|nr:VWA domain-containing protein [Pelagimonas sp.]